MTHLTLSRTLCLLAFIIWIVPDATNATEMDIHPCHVARAHPLEPVPPLFEAPFTLRLPDGSAFTLAGLVPDRLGSIGLAEVKRQAIERFLETPDSSLVAHLDGKAKPDRYGRKSAFISRSTRSQGSEDTLLQEMLIRKGLARVSLQALSPPCARHLLHVEAAARRAKTGLWKEPAFSVKQATDLHLRAILSTYQIITGRVQSVTRNKDGTSYLNFGRIWRQDFTATLRGKALRAWEKNNEPLDELLNVLIYVRGWVEEDGGPLIHVLHPQQLEAIWIEP